MTASRQSSAAALAEWYRQGYCADSPPTVGLEEELIVVESDSLQPVESVDPILGALGDNMFVPEFRTAQLEIVIPPRLTIADLARELAFARGRVVEAAQGMTRVFAAGTHPCSTRPVRVTNLPRYRRIASECPCATRRGLPSGLHVHIAIADADAALAIHNACRTWLPVLTAIAANSPFSDGSDSGLASARLKLTEDLPRSGIPPAFESWLDLAAFVSWGAHGGLFPDMSYLWWDLRLRPEYGTLEFRFADAQTTVDASAAVAAMCQTLVASLRAQLDAGMQLPILPTHVLAENRWRAIRDGLDAVLVDPVTGVAEQVRDMLTRLLLELEPYAIEASCVDELAGAWLLLAENGAVRQRTVAKTAGIDDLLRLLVEETERPTLRYSRPLITP